MTVSNNKVIFSVATLVASLVLAIGIYSGLLAHGWVQNDKSLSILLIGDSYTAGNGAGSYYGESGSYRSLKNWGNRYSQWLNSQGVKTTLVDYSHSGFTSDDILDNEKNILSKAQDNTDLVMFTIGGNDLNFADIVMKCFVVGTRSAANCEESVEYAQSKMPNAISNTKKILEALESRLSSTAEVVLVGYPFLSTKSDFSLTDCKTPGGRKTCKIKKFYPVSDKIRELGLAASTSQSELIDSWNRNHSLKVTYIDDISTTFDGHEPDPSAANRNGSRWINEFMETETIYDGSKTTSRFSFDKNNWYHPGISGHMQVAFRIIEKVGIPSAAKPITKESSDIDVAFVIDDQLMTSNPEEVQLAVENTKNEIRRTTRSARFSQVQFSNSSNFTGLMNAFDGEWRPGVRKMAILLTTGPSPESEAASGFTWQQVTGRSYDLDPVEINIITTGSRIGAQLSELNNLATETGGQIRRSAPDDFSSTMSLLVEQSLAKPFGWIQGPYLAKQGDEITLDASASYSIDSPIKSIEWDLDGDRVFETHTDSLLLTRRFDELFGGTIGVRITDMNGLMGEGSTRLDITDDGDTITFEIDNCPLIANQNQADFDGDGIGDDCDDDIGLPETDMPGVYESYGELDFGDYDDNEDDNNTEDDYSEDDDSTKELDGGKGQTTPTTPRLPLSSKFTLPKAGNVVSILSNSPVRYEYIGAIPGITKVTSPVRSDEVLGAEVKEEPAPSKNDHRLENAKQDSQAYRYLAGVVILGLATGYILRSFKK